MLALAFMGCSASQADAVDGVGGSSKKAQLELATPAARAVRRRAGNGGAQSNGGALGSGGSTAHAGNSGAPEGGAGLGSGGTPIFDGGPDDPFLPIPASRCPSYTRSSPITWCFSVTR